MAKNWCISLRPNLWKTSQFFPSHDDRIGKLAQHAWTVFPVWSQLHYTLSHLGQSLLFFSLYARVVAQNGNEDRGENGAASLACLSNLEPVT
jgi:hypothetical protein